MKRNKLPIHSATLMNLKNIRSVEKSRHKRLHTPWCHPNEILKPGKTVEIRKQISSCWRLAGKGGHCLRRGTWELLGVIEMSVS